MKAGYACQQRAELAKKIAAPFFIEFVREPDPQIGFILGPFTMGQILCACMIFIGIFIIIIKKQHITIRSSGL